MLTRLLALAPLLAQVHLDQPFVPTHAVCFRAQMGPKSKPQKPVYLKAVLLVLRDEKECLAKKARLAALCDAHSRTQNQGDFKTLWRSEWERDRRLSDSIQSACAKRPPAVVDVTRDMNRKGKAQD